MANIDYMKVIDLITKMFSARGDIELKASHDKVDIFDFTLNLKDGTALQCRVYHDQHSLEVVFDKDHLTDSEYQKWLSKFEYELEQEFLRNIKIEADGDAYKHRTKILF